MVAKTNTRPSTLAMLVVCAVWVALLWGSSVEAFRERALNRGASRASRALKSSKSASSSEDYDDDAIDFEDLLDILDGNYTGNFTDDMMDDDYYYGKSSKKGSKSKGSKSKGSKSKGSKSKGSKSDKSMKSSKKSSKKGSSDSSDDDGGFTPEVAWYAVFPDAVDTGYLFYDPVTEYAWYTYTAAAPLGKSFELPDGTIIVIGDTEPAADLDKSFETPDGNIIVIGDTEFTMGKICPMDVASDGEILSELCIEIPPVANDTLTEIVTVEVCPSTASDAILKMAVVVEDTNTTDSSVGSRLIVYDTVAAGVAGSDAIILENSYPGWKSLYGEPGINGKPAFTPDCKTVFASWLLPNDSGEIDIIDTLTIATGIEQKTSGDAEIWRLGTSGRLAGLTATADGKSLISAANIPPEDDLNIGGIVKLDASDGSILDQFIWPENALDLPHNAFTNPLVDSDGATYYIDSLLGLLKFEGDALDAGPVWSAVGGYYGNIAVKHMEAKEFPTSEIDVRRLDEEAPFTAWKPALDETSSTVYGCGMTTRSDEYDGVVALESSNGYKVWHTQFSDYQVVNVGSCRGITDDIIFGPSSLTPSGNAVYAVRENIITALDPLNGATVWTWEFYDAPGVTKFVVVSESLVIAANTGLVVGLGTSVPDNSTEVPSVSPTAAPQPATPRPTRAPLPATDAPTASASTLGFTFFATALAALPLVLALLR